MPLHPSSSNVAPVSRLHGERVLAVMEQLDDVRRANAFASAAGKASPRLVPFGSKLELVYFGWDLATVSCGRPCHIDGLNHEASSIIARRAVFESGVAEAALDDYDQRAFIEWYRLDLETDPAVFVECVIGILEALGENDLIAECCRAAIDGGVFT